MLVLASADSSASAHQVQLQQLLLQDVLQRYRATRLGGDFDTTALAPKAIETEQEPCRYGGRQTITYYDKDGDEETGHPGDYLEVRYDSCKDFSNTLYDGFIRLEVKSVRAVSATNVSAVFDISSDLRLRVDSQNALLKGTMSWDVDFTRRGWDDDILTGQFKISSDHMSLKLDSQSIVYTNYLYRMDTQDGLLNWQFDLTERVALNGKTFDVATEQRFAVRDGACPLPHAGAAIITGAASRMRVTMRQDMTTLLEIDENGDGVFDKTKIVSTPEVFERDCWRFGPRVHRGNGLGGGGPSAAARIRAGSPPNPATPAPCRCAPR
ncbi:hypothetical protein Tchar_00310 [Tepidimonas charontis]|uniref:Uncharacterized protein n=2 Tax=Tepidimonas charontis TaxID=2267262 RepID=A0A554XJF7_9BURK|nr:hypothetical protein Tchar_00310 [Tepidimonas charontis]